MSTHQLDASGQRTFTTVTNDPARTSATVNAKQGDDVVIQLGGFNRIEIPIYDGLEATLITRVSVEHLPKRDENGDQVRDEKNALVYEDREVERKILTFRNVSLQVSGRTDKDREYPGTPHTNYRVVNLANDPYPPVWTKGEDKEETPVDLVG